MTFIPPVEIIQNVLQRESKNGIPANAYSIIPAAVYIMYIFIVFSSVALILGLKRSSRASEWYNVDVAVGGFDYSKALKNSMLWGNISKSLNRVNPVPVRADMLSKIASIIGILVASAKTSPPIIAAHTHPNAEMIIPCLSRTFLT